MVLLYVTDRKRWQTSAATGYRRALISLCLVVRAVRLARSCLSSSLMNLLPQISLFSLSLSLYTRNDLALYIKVCHVTWPEHTSLPVYNDQPNAPLFCVQYNMQTLASRVEWVWWNIIIINIWNSSTRVDVVIFWCVCVRCIPVQSFVYVRPSLLCHPIFRAWYSTFASHTVDDHCILILWKKKQNLNLFHGLFQNRELTRLVFVF